jgi:hypothetical protein
MEDDTVRDDSANDYQARENLWDEQWPTSGASSTHSPYEPDNVDEELPFPEVVGTTDALEAVRDAEPYTPPTDPPVLPGGQEGIHVATGFGLSPDEEAASDAYPQGDEDIRDEVVRLLAENSDTSTLSLNVDVNGGVVRLTGPVPSLLDAERAITVATYAPGVVDVVDDTTVSPAATP